MRAEKPQSSSHKNLEVEVYDCISRYLVWSESRPDVVHLVDLEENENRGQCSCEDWEFRNGDYYLWMKPYECKHIKASKEFKTLIENLRYPPPEGGGG